MFRFQKPFQNTMTHTILTCSYSCTTRCHIPCAKIWWIVSHRFCPSVSNLYSVQLVLESISCVWQVYLQQLQQRHMEYSDVIMSAMASQITGASLVCSIVCSGTDKNIKAPHHWPLWGDSIGTRWFPSQKASNEENVSTWWHNHVRVMTAIIDLAVWSKAFSC